MEAFPILFVSADGRVHRANGAGRDQFGACIGRCCADVLALRTGTDQVLCSKQCAAHLGDDDHGVREATGRLLDGSHARVVCASMGDGVVVMVHPAANLDALKERLSPRELEVVTLVASGLTAKEVAERLGRSPATVRTHLEKAKTSLGAKNQAELVALAMSMGLKG